MPVEYRAAPQLAARRVIRYALSSRLATEQKAQGTGPNASTSICNIRQPAPWKIGNRLAVHRLVRRRCYCAIARLGKSKIQFARSRGYGSTQQRGRFALKAKCGISARTLKQLSPGNPFHRNANNHRARSNPLTPRVRNGGHRRDEGDARADGCGRE